MTSLISETWCLSEHYTNWRCVSYLLTKAKWTDYVPSDLVLNEARNETAAKMRSSRVRLRQEHFYGSSQWTLWLFADKAASTGELCRSSCKLSSYVLLYYYCSLLHHKASILRTSLSVTLYSDNKQLFSALKLQWSSKRWMCLWWIVYRRRA